METRRLRARAKWVSRANWAWRVEPYLDLNLWEGLGKGAHLGLATEFVLGRARKFQTRVGVGLGICLVFASRPLLAPSV